MWEKKEQKERDKEKGTKVQKKRISSIHAFIVKKLKITFITFFYRNWSFRWRSGVGEMGKGECRKGAVTCRKFVQTCCTDSRSHKASSTSTLSIIAPQRIPFPVIQEKFNEVFVLFCFVLLVFLGLHPWHIEVPHSRSNWSYSHSHSNLGSELHLQPTSQPMATPDP